MVFRFVNYMFLDGSGLVSRAKVNQIWWNIWTFIRCLFFAWKFWLRILFLCRRRRRDNSVIVVFKAWYLKIITCPRCDRVGLLHLYLQLISWFLLLTWWLIQWYQFCRYFIMVLSPRCNARVFQMRWSVKRWHYDVL